ncbi:MAG: hypothetical protein A3G41_01925 [Elusimicrobia bacterium RIFCSPLOWO2_12_FULL_59_9]|nr:MAG: hypothetical protein A3G41_01925 [Elusimicrobia bacterium RIFCSPLOWO2_12_FULL_59_9]
MTNFGALAYSALSRLKAEPGLKLSLDLPHDDDVEDAANSFQALEPLFPGVSGLPPAVFSGTDDFSHNIALERLEAGARAAVASSETWRAPTFEPGEFAALKLEVQTGNRFARQALIDKLSRMGYRRDSFVENPGDFAVRGEVVDVFGLAGPPARLLFDGNRLEAIRVFDPATHRSSGRLERAVFLPANRKPARPLRDWLGADWKEHQLQEGFKSHASFQGSVDLALRQIRQWAESGCRVFLFSLNRGEEERLQELLDLKEFAPGVCQFLIGPLASGFFHESGRAAFLTSGEIFNRSYRVGYGRWAGGARASGPKRFGWADLKGGDYVVHRHYGVARYLGMKTIQDQDCLCLAFKGEDKVYVPLHEFGMVQKFIGADGKRPKLSSLNTRGWEAVQNRVKEGVRELAAELLRSEALRRARPGHAFAPDGHLEEEFAEAFPFEETPDQKKAIEEIKLDLCSPRAMERLVVGDVGFGKTEVAMRAAFKCALDSRQVAVLVPTTILADQHFHTFRKRFAEYPVSVGRLSRFQSAKEEKQTLAGLQTGVCDVVIGTHRLLQKDVRFKDLGLVIVDEEHRFGVKDKERLKNLRKNVDFLGLSATPIPRSLYQSMAGLKSISFIETPPAGRQAVQTVVSAWDEAMVRGAILHELERGGQVYYVHNRVQTLPQRLAYLQGLLPGVRIQMAHGQLSGAALEKTMWEFFNKKFDVLAASSIIESGLDNPAVNTMIIENAHEFGLAQLYQLRGRIGRERQKAACYLLHGAGAAPQMSEEAAKRLEALREFSDLGSGFRLAMRDLEMRGAGDLIGSRQHGFLSAVGLEFYCDLLNGEIDRLKGAGAADALRDQAVWMDVKLPMSIPPETLPSEMERLNFYKRILNADVKALNAVQADLADLCGPLPEPVRNLLHAARLREGFKGTGIRSILQKSAQALELRWQPGREVSAAKLRRFLSDYAGRIQFFSSPEGDGFRVTLEESSPFNFLEDVLGVLKAKG